MTDSTDPQCPHPDDLESLVDGSLSDPDIEQEIACHLDTCDRCRRYVDDLAGWDSMADRFRDLAPSSQTPEEPPRDASEQSRGKPAGGWFWSLIVLVVAGISILALRANEPAVANRPVERRAPPVSPQHERASTPPKKPMDSDPAFVVLRDGRDAREFVELPDAVAWSIAGDVIEIRRSLHFNLPTMEITQPLTIRAEAGMRPVLQPHIGQHNGTQPLFLCHASLTLQGLSLVQVSEHHRVRSRKPPILIRVDEGTLRLDHCNIDLATPGYEDIAILAPATNVEVIDSRIRGGVAIDSGSTRPGNVSVRGSLLHGATPLFFRHGQSRHSEGIRVEMDRSTVISECAVTVAFDDQLNMHEPSARITFEVARSLIISRDSVIRLSRIEDTDRSAPLEKHLATTQRNHVVWQSEKCVFAVEQRYVSWHLNRVPFQPSLRREIARTKSLPRIDTLAHWCELSGASDSSSLETSFPIEGPLFEPYRFDELETVQMAALLQAGVESEQDMSNCGAPARD